MTEVDPLLVLLLQTNSFVGAGVTVEHEIMPIDEQLNFTTGDVAMLASADTPLERDFALLQAVDPAEHAETYPDWEERLLNSYVLCTVFSREDPGMHLGWFSRVKILPISHEHYQEALTWVEKGFPEELPNWTTEYFHRYTDMLSSRAPEIVPRSVTCPHCESRDIELVVHRHLTYTGRVGIIKVEDKERHVPTSDPGVDSHHHAQLHCTNCHATADLSDEEWQLPDITN